ncbi:hypothetical protein BJ508DRAFT_315227 [Ascobolus immersus RN42]|uniref:Uncharacterized protein n=1 Tax=Ascobolus immersus RN42 TaxID=1160509 RepID=A0A3N4HQD5_ASCIM|nr:hypothetical protein BJ508DRAFT_315227 [Ascobolus immersus RN42]
MSNAHTQITYTALDTRAVNNTKETTFFYSTNLIPDIEIEAVGRINWFYEDWLAMHLYPTYNRAAMPTGPDTQMEGADPEPPQLSYFSVPKDQIDGKYYKRDDAAPQARRAIGVQGHIGMEIIPEATKVLHGILGPKWYYVAAPGARRRIARKIMWSGRKHSRHQVYPTTLFAQALSSASGKHLGGFAVVYFCTTLDDYTTTLRERHKRTERFIPAGSRCYWLVVTREDDVVPKKSFHRFLGLEYEAVMVQAMLRKYNTKDWLNSGSATLEGSDPGFYYPLVELRDGEQTVMNGRHPLREVKRVDEL